MTPRVRDTIQYGTCMTCPALPVSSSLVLSFSLPPPPPLCVSTCPCSTCMLYLCAYLSVFSSSLAAARMLSTASSSMPPAQEPSGIHSYGMQCTTRFHGSARAPHIKQNKCCHGCCADAICARRSVASVSECVLITMYTTQWSRLGHTHTPSHHDRAVSRGHKHGACSRAHTHTRSKSLTSMWVHMNV